MERKGRLIPPHMQIPLERSGSSSSSSPLSSSPLSQSASPTAPMTPIISLPKIWDEIDLSDQETVPDLAYVKGFSMKSCGGDHHWNSRAQTLISNYRAAASELEALSILSDLDKHVGEFEESAMKQATKLIEEFPLSLAKKSVKPLEGTSEMFLIDGILFKFAVDRSGLFGGDQFAMKAASQEFNGLAALLSKTSLRNRVGTKLPRELRFPLVAMIGYLGHRILAVATIPLLRDTPSYGQGEPGTDFVTTQETLAKEIFSSLHLKPHQARFSDSSHLVYGSSEVEIHSTPESGLNYLTEAFRILPPTGEGLDTRIRNSFLWQRFRPEFLSLYRHQLNPDALSAWLGGSEEENANDNAEIQEATKHLLEVHLPKVATLVEAEFSHCPMDQVRIACRLHERGINLRYIGLFRANLYPNSHLKVLCLAEVIARVLKNEMKQIWRRSKNLFDGTASILNLINRIFGDHEEGSLFRRVTLKSLISGSFTSTLTEHELSDTLDLLTLVPLGFVFHRLRELRALPIRPRPLGKLVGTEKFSPLRSSDLDDFLASKRTLQSLSFERARALIASALQGDQEIGLVQGFDGIKASNFTQDLTRALLHLKDALASSPDDQEAWNLRAYCFLMLARDRSIQWPVTEIARRTVHSIDASRRALAFGEHPIALANMVAALQDLVGLFELHSSGASQEKIPGFILVTLHRIAQGLGFEERQAGTRKALAISLTTLEKFLAEPSRPLAQDLARECGDETIPPGQLQARLACNLRELERLFSFPGEDAILGQLPLSPDTIHWNTARFSEAIPMRYWAVLTTWGQRWLLKYAEGERGARPRIETGGNASTIGSTSSLAVEDEDEDDSDEEASTGFAPVDWEQGRDELFAALEVSFPPDLPHLSLYHLARGLSEALARGELGREEVMAKVQDIFGAALAWAHTGNPVAKNSFYIHDQSVVDVRESQVGSVYALWGEILFQIDGPRCPAGFEKLQQAVEHDPDLATPWFRLGNEEFYLWTVRWDPLREEDQRRRLSDGVRAFTKAMEAPSTTLSDLPFLRFDYGIQDTAFVTDDIDNHYLDQITEVSAKNEGYRREAAYQLTVFFLRFLERAPEGPLTEFLKTHFADSQPVLSSFLGHEAKSKSPQLIECRANYDELCKKLEMKGNEVSKEINYRASVLFDLSSQKKFNPMASLSEIEALLVLLKSSTLSSRHESSAMIVSSFLKIILAFAADPKITFAQAQRTLEVFTRASELFSSLTILPPIWVDPQIGFAIAALVPRVVSKESDQVQVRNFACEGLVHAMDAAFVSAGQQSMPVSEFFKANTTVFELCQEVHRLCQEVSTGLKHEGWLTKRGGFVKTWKRRWFRMQDGEISYLTSKDDPVPKGKIPLYAILEVGQPAVREKKSCSFTISTGGRTFMIEAQSADDAVSWVIAIRTAIPSTQILKVASFVFQETMNTNKTMSKSLLNALLPTTVFETHISSIKIFSTMMSDGRTHFN